MATGYETTVFFGDSLTDTGNLYQLTADALHVAWPPDAYGYTQKFSNGPLWSQVAASQLGQANTLNYAFGGAEAVGSQTLEEYMVISGLPEGLVKDPSYLNFDINLSAQVERFLNDHGSDDLSDFSASLLIGLNDYARFVPSSNDPAMIMQEATALIAAVTTATLEAALQLAQAGVGQIVLNTLPEANFLPLIESQSEPLKSLAPLAFSTHNDIITAQAAALNQLGFNIMIVDFEALSAEILDDPFTFGFIAPLEDSVLMDMDGNPLDDGYDSDQVAFFDEVHPTEAGHGVLGIFHSESLTSNVQIAGSGHDILAGTRDEDLVLASRGDDQVELGSGDDVGLGGLGDDAIEGRQGNDILSGGSGADTLEGGLGQDVLAGGQGNDSLQGGKGNDVLIDGLGSDYAFGGNGDDVFLYTDAELIGGAGGEDFDVFDGGNGHDTLYLALSETNRAIYESNLGGGLSVEDSLLDIGISVVGIEDVFVLDDRLELADVETDVNLGEADQWGFV